MNRRAIAKWQIDSIKQTANTQRHRLWEYGISGKWGALPTTTTTLLNNNSNDNTEK